MGRLVMVKLLVASSGAMELVVLALLLAISAQAMELVVDLLVATRAVQLAVDNFQGLQPLAELAQGHSDVLGSLQTEKLTPETTKLKNFPILPNLTPDL